ncbi:hypothetical protein [Rufibacter ruber]|nr:hypothetical protein [Rufibacter ruber]
MDELVFDVNFFVSETPELTPEQIGEISAMGMTSADFITGESAGETVLIF